MKFAHIHVLNSQKTLFMTFITFYCDKVLVGGNMILVCQHQFVIAP